MTDYELTRRDAIAALAASGVAVGGAALTWDSLEADGESGADGAMGDHERETLLALADTVYPSEVSGSDEFVETYVVGRIEDRPEYAEGVHEAVSTLDEYCRTWDEAPYVDLDADRQDGVLRDFGVDDEEPDPDGHRAERVRYYLVNELLYALYSSPTGGNLVGLENPQGHPGGTASYQQLPE